jgi:hypothetical protein
MPDEDTRNDPPTVLSKTVKGMPIDQWDAIVRAAKANKETIAEYIWAAHEARSRRVSWPEPQQIPANHEVIPPDAHGLPREQPMPTSAELSLIDLFDIICKFAATEPAPGNKALLQEARGVLYARLREAREGRRSPIALPGN